MKNSFSKVMGYMLVILLGLLVALPNVLPDTTLSRLPSWMPHQRVSLGLDLRETAGVASPLAQRSENLQIQWHGLAWIT